MRRLTTRATQSIIQYTVGYSAQNTERCGCINDVQELSNTGLISSNEDGYLSHNIFYVLAEKLKG